MVLFVLWSCFLLLVFYEEHIAMQHTVMAARISHLQKPLDNQIEAPEATEVATSATQNQEDELDSTFEELPTLSSLDTATCIGFQRAGSAVIATIPSGEVLGAPKSNKNEPEKDVNSHDIDSDVEKGGASMPNKDNERQKALNDSPFAGHAPYELSTSNNVAAGPVGDGSTDQEEGDHEENENQFDLWPVRRGDPPHLAPSRPPYSGQYACLVIDEPPRKFAIKEGMKIFGIRLKLSNRGSLNEIQAEPDEMMLLQNFKWISGALSRRGGTMRRSSTGKRASVPVGNGDTRKSVAIVEEDEDGGEQGRKEEKEETETATEEDKKRFARTAGAMNAVGSAVKKAAGGVVGMATTAAGAVIPRSVSLPWEVRAKEDKDAEAIVAIGARMRSVAATFKRLFGSDFNCVVPIYPTQKVDATLHALYWCQARLARAELALSTARQSHQDAATAKAAKRLAQLGANAEKLRAQEKALQAKAAELADQTLDGPPCASFIAVFHTAKAAAMAAELNINPVQWRGMHVQQAPDPDNINWTALQRDWWARHLRASIALVAIVIIMLVPIGLITGSFSQLDAALCGGQAGQTGTLSGTWFCSDEFWGKLLRNVITGMLPAILMSVYQAVLLPVYIYTCALAESRHVSLTDLDRRCAELFFHWNWSNFFVQTLLGGTIFNGLRQAIDNPKEIIDLLGTAVPASANFFINYVLYRALAMTFFRLFWPHAVIFADILRWLHILPSK